jgi:acyl-CoA thioester hydrolase
MTKPDSTPFPLLAGFPVVIDLPVQWGDQDAFAHVNNVVFLRWLESSRISYMSRIGVFQLFPHRGIGPILASIKCDYRRQVTFPDTVAVGVRAARVGRTSIGLEHAIASRGQGQVVAEAAATIVVFDYRANTPYPVPAAIRQAIETLERRDFAQPGA